MTPRLPAALAVLVALLLAACGGRPAADASPDAAALLARARQAHGADRLDRAVVTFGFRGESYRVERDGGRFAYARTRTDSTGAVVRDVLTNDGLTRTVAGEPVPLDSLAHRRAMTTLNSVVYFALLPYPLADPAVRPRALGTDTLAGDAYDLVEVTFEEDGGGRDWEDRFVYWLHPDRHTVDYLAYHFHTDGGGTRFRAAYNPRTVGGVRFADYYNFAADSAGVPLEAHGRLFEEGRLELLSRVVLDSVRVEPLR